VTKTQAISRCVGTLSMLKFFPAEAGAREAIMHLIDRMASNVEQVLWLEEAASVQFNDWPGPHDLRCLFCTRWKPADGHEANFPVGHRISMENEMRAIEESNDYKKLGPGDAGMKILKQLLPGKVRPS
jgi:hypothetical protein